MIQRLPNGFTAVLVENHVAPVVALQMWVKVGAADELPTEAGLAHLHEHMLFKGTARRAPGQIAREVESRGGEINAWTSHDQTVYHLVLAAPFFAEGLDILADAMRGSSFDEDELRRETQVVVEEIKRSEDSPSRRLSRELFGLAYREHPYRLPVIGTAESVLSFQRSQILDFYHRHYTPTGMVLVVVGDVDETRALAEIERLFGDFQGAPSPALVRAKEPAQTDPRVRVMPNGVRETRIALAFHIPELLHPDIPALDLLSVMLGQGESARLSARLRRQERLFNDVYAYGYTPLDPGLWVAGGTTTRGREMEAISALAREIERVRTAPFESYELAKAKHLLDSESVYQRETVQGWARKVGFYETMAGSLEAEAEYQARVQGTSLDEVTEVALHYLAAEGSSFVALSPSDLEEPLDPARILESVRAEVRAGAGAPRRLRQPQEASRTSAPAQSGLGSLGTGEPLEVFPLSTGGTLLVKREPQVPLVALRAAYVGGLRAETEANNGITTLLSRVIRRGAAGKGGDAIASAIDGMAGSLQGVGGRNSFGLRGEFLARNLREGLGIFLDCLLLPDLAIAEVERERAQQLQEIHAREDNPAGLAFELFARTLFTVHPNRLSLLGEKPSVAALTPDILRRWSAETHTPEGLTLAVVGDVRPAEVRDDVETAIAARARLGAARRVQEVPREPRPTSPRRAHRLLQKAQTHLLLGFLGARFKDPQRQGLEVLSSILSGQGGRLFVELRDKRSLAYSVTSMSVDGIDPGYFAVYIGTSPEKAEQALVGIREQLSLLRQEQVTPEELERAQRYLIGVHSIGLQRRSSVAGAMAHDHAYGLGADAYSHYPEQIRTVTREDVLAAAQQFLDPAGEVLAEVGPQRTE